MALLPTRWGIFLVNHLGGQKDGWFLKHEIGGKTAEFYLILFATEPALLDGIADQLGPAGEAQFFHATGAVGLDCFHTDVKFTGDFYAV